MSNDKRSRYKDLEKRENYMKIWREKNKDKNRSYQLKHYYKRKETKTPKPKSEYNKFVAQHYHDFDYLPYKERVGAVGTLRLEKQGKIILSCN